MKHLKYFEKDKPTLQPEVGNYVICKEGDFSKSKDVNSFIMNNVGRIKEIDETRAIFKYLVEWENIPKNLQPRFVSNSRFMSRDEIVQFSFDKQFLQTVLDGRKYNL